MPAMTGELTIAECPTPTAAELHHIRKCVRVVYPSLPRSYADRDVPLSPVVTVRWQPSPLKQYLRKLRFCSAYIRPLAMVVGDIANEMTQETRI